MKRLFIVRHAKTEWLSFEKSDIARSLTSSGIQEAKYMAKIFEEKKVKVDFILCSSALRARQTASFFIEKNQIDIEKVMYLDELYLAPSHIMYNTINLLNNAAQSVLIIGHNPGITDWVNSMTEQVKIDEMPTCGIFAVQSSVAHWIDFEKSKKNFLFFESPKIHQSNFSK